MFARVGDVVVYTSKACDRLDWKEVALRCACIATQGAGAQCVHSHAKKSSLGLLL